MVSMRVVVIGLVVVVVIRVMVVIVVVVRVIMLMVMVVVRMIRVMVVIVAVVRVIMLMVAIVVVVCVIMLMVVIVVVVGMLVVVTVRVFEHMLVRLFDAAPEFFRFLLEFRQTAVFEPLDFLAEIGDYPSTFFVGKSPVSKRRVLFHRAGERFVREQIEVGFRQVVENEREKFAFGRFVESKRL